MRLKLWRQMMSEKRFRITTLPKSNAVAFDEKQKKYYIGIDFENLLNELNEENQELKRLIKKMGELGGFNKHLIKTICEDLK